MRLIDIRDGGAFVELDKEDCLELGRACRACQWIAGGDGQAHREDLGMVSDYNPELEKTYERLATLFTSLMVATAAAGLVVETEKASLRRIESDLCNGILPERSGWVVEVR